MDELEIGPTHFLSLTFCRSTLHVPWTNNNKLNGQFIFQFRVYNGMLHVSNLNILQMFLEPADSALESTFVPRFDRRDRLNGCYYEGEAKIGKVLAKSPRTWKSKAQNAYTTILLNYLQQSRELFRGKIYVDIVEIALDNNN